MIIKNNNKAVDVQKNQHVCWEGQKTSRRFYVKKTKTLIKTEYGSDPSTIPNISWEGGTTEKFNLYRKETYSVREGFTTRTEEQIYNYPNATFKRNSGDTSGCTINNTPNQNGPYAYNNPFSVTFSKRDNASSDRTIIIYAMGFRGDIYEEANITITQTKRDKYVTKLDNASITTDLIPASGGNISSGTLTFRKTYNTGESENVTENITFSTVSATTKGTTESPVTNVKTIPAGGTTQKQTTIDGVTLTHPSFTVKQAANTKSVMTPESKKTTSVILTINPTVVYDPGGTVTFTLQRMYTLNNAVYLYTSGSTSGGEINANQGPEAVNANQTYTITGGDVSSTTGSSYEIPQIAPPYNVPPFTTIRTLKFKTIYDNIVSNEVSVFQKVDGRDASKPITFSNLNIISFYYETDTSNYHFPASGKTIVATDCILDFSYDYTYITMANKTKKETAQRNFYGLTTDMYTFTPTSVDAPSLGTTQQSANNNYKSITVEIKNLKHGTDDVKDSNGNFLTASKTAILTRQGNSGTQASNPTSTILSVSVIPTSFDYKGGTATLTATLIKRFNITWTSGATSTNTTNTDVTNSTTFSGTYREYGQTQQNIPSFTGNKPTIPNIQSSTKNRTYTFRGEYGSYSNTTTLTQTGNTIFFTVTFYKNNTYAKWSRTTGNESITKNFSKDTPYTELIPDETPTWVEGSNLKYVFLGNYSTTTTGAAVTSGSLLTGNINLYARWSTASTGYVKVSWDPNGGQLSPTSGGTSTSSVIYDYHNPGPITCQPADIGYNNIPSKVDNTFLGWYYNSTYYKTFPVSITLGTTPIKFNAMYTVTEKTVYWNSNGGTFSDGTTLKAEKKNYGASISAYSSSPSKAATTGTTYTFKGWSLTTDGTVVTFPYTLTTTSATFNFYAIYSSSTRKYTVIWNLNGGNINGNVASIQDVVNHGDTVSFSKYTPVRTGYTFNGWATSSTATSGNTTGNSAPITWHTTFYATWKSATLTPILLVLA